MNPSLEAVAAAAVPPAALALLAESGPALPASPTNIGTEDWRPWILAAAFLLFSGLFAVLRSALSHSITARVLEGAPEGRRRERLAELLERTDALATSAAVFKLASDLVFGLLVLVLVVGGGDLSWSHIVGSLLISVPSLILLGELLPVPFVDRRGDAFLRRVLPAFHLLQLPLEEFVRGLERTRRVVLRAFGLRAPSPAAREIVQGIRDKIEDAVADGELAETEREFIENVMDFRDVDVAEIMTPRTEIRSLPVEGTVEEALAVVTECPHSRLPVHDGNLDEIVGTVAAKDILELLGSDVDPGSTLAPIVRPAYFVPETKRVSELLGELRRARTKMAIVLDEYGGTAGMVTVGDLLAELVGEFPDEHDEDEPESILFDETGTAEVDAGLRVSDVNEELGLSIPEEEDYETLAGFVLAELGHFPDRGEKFEQGGVEYEVREASDRRVLRVAVRRLAAAPATSTG